MIYLLEFYYEYKQLKKMIGYIPIIHRIQFISVFQLHVNIFYYYQLVNIDYLKYDIS
jgi:hypothetical protein